MKKIVKRCTNLVLTVIVILTVMCLCTACTGWAGTYKFDKMITSNGFELGVGDEFLGYTITEDYMVLEIESDGDFTLKNGSNATSGTWEEKDDGIILTVNNGRKVGVTKSMGKLTLKFDGNQYILKKSLF